MSMLSRKEAKASQLKLQKSTSALKYITQIRQVTQAENPDGAMNEFKVYVDKHDCLIITGIDFDYPVDKGLEVLAALHKCAIAVESGQANYREFWELVDNVDIRLKPLLKAQQEYQEVNIPGFSRRFPYGAVVLKDFNEPSVFYAFTCPNGTDFYALSKRDLENGYYQRSNDRLFTSDALPPEWLTFRDKFYQVSDNKDFSDDTPKIRQISHYRYRSYNRDIYYPYHAIEPDGKIEKYSFCSPVPPELFTV